MEMKDAKDLELVNLPPEGKVATQKEYVELPSQNDFKSGKGQGLVVELPDHDCIPTPSLSSSNLPFSNNNCSTSVDFSDSKSSLSSSYDGISSTESTVQMSEVNLNSDHWTYTLYDFQGKGIVSKQDFKQLFDSICMAVNQNSMPDMENSLKVHVEIEHKANNNTLKSPNKYTPSKLCKGMLFPPPNSDEAEKISNYIKEKVHQHRSYTIKKSTRHHNNDEEVCNSQKHYNVDYIKHPMYNVESSTKSWRYNDDSCSIRPRYKNESCTTCSSKKTQYRKQNLNKILRLKNPCESCNINVGKYRQQYYNFNSNDVTVHNKDHVNISSASSDSESQRTTHSSVHKLSSKSSCRGEFNNQPYNYVENDDSSNFRLRHRCPCHKRLKQSRIKETSFSYKDHHQNSGASKQIKIDARKQIHNKNEHILSKNFGDLESRQNFKTPVRLKTSCNATREFIRSPRPDVWPGECSSVKTTPEKEYKKEELCICKRMLGLDYPCNHGSNVFHHHHYHYYIPAQ